MLSTALCFPRGKGVLNTTPFLHRRLHEFSKGCCYRELNEGTKQMAKLCFINLSCIHVKERNIIFTNRKFVATTLAKHFTRYKGVFEKKSQIWLCRFSIQLW